MLDFLLVLGQVPGTHLFLTFNGLAVLLLLWFSFYFYKRHHGTVNNYMGWLAYRSAVRYRRIKRIVKSKINQRRYRIALAIKRTKRFVRQQIRNAYRATIIATILSIKRAVRNLKLRIRRAKRAIAFASVTLPMRKVRKLKMRIRRVKRNMLLAIAKRYRRLIRLAIRKNRKFEKAFKSSKLHEVYAGVTVSIRPGSRD